MALGSRPIPHAKLKCAFEGFSFQNRSAVSATYLTGAAHFVSEAHNVNAIIMGVLRIDRDALWSKLFTFERHAAAPDDDCQTGDSRHKDSADQHVQLIQRALASDQHEPLRAMLTQRLGYWLRMDVVPEFWRFFEGYGAKLQRSMQTKRKRHAFSLFCAEQLTLAMQFAEEAFAHCVELASIFDDHKGIQLRAYVFSYKST